MLPSPIFAMAAATSSGGFLLISEECFKHVERPEINLRISSFRMRFHVGPPPASGAGMRIVHSRRRAVPALHDEWKRGCRHPCDNKFVIFKNFLKFHKLSIYRSF